jgi:hypothetical protein
VPGGQAIGLHSLQKARAEIMRQAKELVDVALPVGHMHAALRRAQKRRRVYLFVACLAPVTNPVSACNNPANVLTIGAAIRPQQLEFIE